jgi:UDP-glucose 4-epimerase
LSLNKILVTGASGFIGQRMLARLKVRDSEIRILSRKPYKEYDTVCCDFLENNIPESALDSIDTIFHIAGFAHDFSNKNDSIDKYYKVNVSATIELAKLAIQAGVKRFIFVSTVKAGGVLSTIGENNEMDQAEPQDIYGKTKREAELGLLEICSSSDMQIVIIRPALVYGPGMKGNLKLMLKGVRNGWFPPLPETKNKRSMIHVDDLVHALIMVAKNKQTNGEIFIATDGNTYSSFEIYQTMRKLSGKSEIKWSIPIVFFKLAAKFNLRLKNKIQKILGSECYSSKKLQSIGFKAHNSLKKMNQNETFI